MCILHASIHRTTRTKLRLAQSLKHGLFAGTIQWWVEIVMRPPCAASVLEEVMPHKFVLIAFLETIPLPFRGVGPILWQRKVGAGGCFLRESIGRIVGRRWCASRTLHHHTLRLVEVLVELSK